MFSFENTMRQAIEQMDEYAWKRGENGGLKFGFPVMDSAFEGIDNGIILIAGKANAGKSAMCLQLAWQICTSNDDVVVVYFSLDDNIKDIMPRIIAMDQKIPINAVAKPKKYEHIPDVMKKRQIGLDKLRSKAKNFYMLDNSNGSSIEYISKVIMAINNEAVQNNCKMVVFIDNFHDITTDNKLYTSDENSKYNHIATQLNHLSNQYYIPIICTAEFRKLNGYRRPIEDDVRETVKLAYIAKAIMLCYNEVGLKDQSAEVYYTRPGDSKKYPIFEVHIAKNKYSSFKGRLFYEFIPEFSFMNEVPKETIPVYLSRVS